MTEQEILEGLKKADALLAEYKQTIQPIAEELARQKSIVVYGKEDCYNGALGCYESGCDAVCLHIKDEVRGKTWEDDRLHHDKAIDFGMMWDRKAAEAGVKHIYITGHF